MNSLAKQNINQQISGSGVFANVQVYCSPDREYVFHNAPGIPTLVNEAILILLLTDTPEPRSRLIPRSDKANSNAEIPEMTSKRSTQPK